MRLAIDFDGCLVRTSDVTIPIINLACGTNYTVKDITHWNWARKDPQTERAFWGAFDIMDRTGIRIGLRPYDEHTTVTLARLALRHDVAVVTANMPAAEADIREWLRHHLPYTHRLVDVMCLGRVGLKEKLALNFDLYLDDNPGMAREIPLFPNKGMLLANCKWNEFLDEARTVPLVDTPQVRRFRSWDQVPALIAQAQKKKGVLSWPAVSPSSV